MAAHWMFIMLLVIVPFSKALTEVNDLDGEADFRSIRLHWKYDRAESGHYHFAITYCEDQSWGKYRCKKQKIEEPDANEIQSSNNNYREFEASITGLRMATNYTLEVKPINDGEDSGRGRAFGREIVVRTKGFSARATNCLANSSVVEVETGPHFGGKISVEGTEDPRCSTAGDRKSLQTSYLLNIDHEVCGSEVQNTSVLTFIIVQENLPILTHSTRRFLVMCNYVPETFTVRAGVSLPEDINSVGDELSPVDQSIFEVDPSELFDSANNLFDSRISEEVGRALKMSAEEKDKEPRMWAHLVLMVILVMAAVVGLSCAVWHFVRHARANNRQGFMSPQEEPRAMEETSSMEAVVRDYTNGDNAPNCVENPVALFQTSFMTGQGTVLDEVYDLRDDAAMDDICAPPPVDFQGSDDLTGLPQDLDMKIDPCQLSVHDLNLSDLPPVPIPDMRPDDLCFDSQGPDLLGEDELLELDHPVETINPLPIIISQSADSTVLTFDPFHNIDMPPSPFADEYPIPEIYQTPNSSVIILDPLALHHQSMINIPDPILEDDLIMGTQHPPLSLQHIPQGYFEDEVPPHLILDDDNDDDVFEEEGHLNGSTEFPGTEGNSFDMLPSDGRNRSLSRHPSLDQNWKLGDGEGQIFPAFSQ